MVNQFSVAYANALAAQFESVVGASMRVQGFNAGSMPANCAAAPTGTKIAEGVADPDYLSAPSSGVVTLTGTLQLTGLAAAGAPPGTAITYVRFYDNAGVVCHRQCRAGPIVNLTTSGATAANGLVLTFAAAPGVEVGMQVSGTGIVPGTTVLVVAGGNITLSRASVAGVSSSAAIQFKHDIGFDNNSVSTGQVATVTADSLSFGGLL